MAASKAHRFHAVKPAPVRFLAGPFALVGKGEYLRVENMAAVVEVEVEVEVGGFGEIGVFGILPDGLCLRDDKREKDREPDVDVSMEEGKVVSVERANKCAGMHLLYIWEREKNRERLKKKVKRNQS